MIVLLLGILGFFAATLVYAAKVDRDWQRKQQIIRRIHGAQTGVIGSPKRAA